MKAKIVKPNKLNNREIEEMFKLFNDYYSNGVFEVFKCDLFEKEHLILIKNKNTVVGFCTLKCLREKINGQNIVAVYTGDTIVKKEYWGKNPLGVAFSRYLLRQRLLNPTKKIFWFLTSKGYKTYLTMTKNFRTYYPRYESQNIPPLYKNIMETLADKKYGHKFIRAKGIIHHAGSSDFLKDEVAPITSDLLSNPQISFFQKANPDWEKGDELVCLSEFELVNALDYSLKKLKKILR